jgi:CheY-like chemotaxis protein
MMGGEIGVESTPGEGSRFFFTEKCGISEAPPPFSQTIIKENFTKKKVLVIDDSDIVCKTLKSYLDDFSIACEVEKDAYVAIEKIIEMKIKDIYYDIVIIDLNMPTMNGLTAAKIIRDDLDTPRERTEIVIVTSIDDKKIYNTLNKEGFANILPKPITQSALFNKLSDIFVHKPSTQKKMYNKSNIDQLSGRHFLVVEDNEINRLVAKGLLNDMGAEADTVTSGEEAITLLEKDYRKYDAVFMDLQMPGLDGYETTRRLRRKFSPEDLIIIAMSADAMLGIKEACLDAGMNDYISKPIVLSNLVDTIMRWVKPSNIQQKNDTKPLDTAETQNSLISSDNIPELDEIDIQAGIKALGGNIKFYNEMLLQFRDTHSDEDEKIQRALDQKDFKTAIRLTHSLKGTTGIIKAQKLYHSVEKLYNAMEKSPESPETKTLFKDFSQLLHSLIKSIDDSGLLKNVKKRIS